MTRDFRNDSDDGERTPTATRRAILSAVGAGLAAGATATSAGAERPTANEYVLEQGDRCVPVRAFDGDKPVETFYGYHLPKRYAIAANGAITDLRSDAYYASVGTEAFQRPNTSIAMLYRGPEGLSLVFVHGAVGEKQTGGAVSFEFSGLSADGEWAVKDDLYLNPDTGRPASTNYDRWSTDGTSQRIDWTWGANGTDGGAFRGLGDDVDVTVDPAFNEDAALYGEHYEGDVERWQFLTGSADDPERISLAMDEPIRIRAGSCGSSGGGGSSGGDGDSRDRDEGADRESHEESESADSGEDRQEKREREEDEREEKGERNEEERNEEGEDHGKHEGNGHERGKGRGHEKGKGKGHSKKRGEGHEKENDE
ncbi:MULTISPECIES: hypothetical protein [Halorussus]|uniref:hypothetical protein n=1 Tax=Halorussus TaxID=1070314 RepID=UPI0020A182BD|nr:hypothetical protein [Halorussus vallis]USZ77345.1 hypothetical protein NGM07_08430 [Halorussus vallis]